MVSIREILQGALTRFLPTAGGGALAILLAFDGRNVAGIHVTGWLLLAAMLMCETVGFASLLWRVRFRLERGAAVTGRRSVIAGALGIVGLFAGSVFAQGAGLRFALLLASAAGAAAGSLVYWPWLRRRVSESEIQAWEGVDVAMLGAGRPTVRPSPTSHREPLRSATVLPNDSLHLPSEGDDGAR